MDTAEKPIREAVEIFLKLKDRIDKIGKYVDKNKIKELKTKIRSRAREIPEKIAELGLIPTLTFCLAKSEKENLRKAVVLMETGIEGLKNIKVIKKEGGEKQTFDISSDKFAYALYTYILLKYLGTHLGTIKLKSNNQEEEIKLDLTELVEHYEQAVDTIYRYLIALAQGTLSLIVYKFIQSYLIQFKRLCEMEFPAER